MVKWRGHSQWIMEEEEDQRGCIDVPTSIQAGVEVTRRVIFSPGDFVMSTRYVAADMGSLGSLAVWLPRCDDKRSLKKRKRSSVAGESRGVTLLR